MPMIVNQGSPMSRILLLGGTAEAGALARLLAGAGMDAVYSYAGRTARPAAQPLQTRIGGFGGATGLADYLRAHRIGRIIDATHPFAARISRNAIDAASQTGVPILSLQRPAWEAEAGDDWHRVPDLAAAAVALPDRPAHVFLALGRQHLQAFAGMPHRWLLRLVDPPAGPLPLPGAHAVVARGPFTPADDQALLSAHGITHVIARDAGGDGARAKLVAARRLRLPVILIDRPVVPVRRIVATPEDAMRWLHQTPAALALRGV